MPRDEVKQECQLKRNRVPHVRDSLIVANGGPRQLAGGVSFRGHSRYGEPSHY